MPELSDLRFLTVAGKGGVGRTTVSAAIALAAARRGKRPLVAMCNAKERLSTLLETPAVGPRISTILEVKGPSGANVPVDAVNLVPEIALAEYGMMVLKVRALYKAIFENRFVAAFLRATPGMDQWAMLGKAFFHTTEEREPGRPRYDVVILDAPATGHSLEMLRVPKVILDVAPPGLLRREAEHAWTLLSDPARAGIVLVTLPEEMPTNETLEHYAALRDELQLPVARLVVNAFLPVLFDPPALSGLERLVATSHDGDPLQSLISASRARATREGLQEEALERMVREIHVPRTELPRLFVPKFGRSAVDALSRAF